jgi:hypothetical protein
LTVSPAEQGAQTAEWYPYKNIIGFNQIEIPGLVGEAIMAPNDPDGYFVMNLRTRGYFQGHYHRIPIDSSGGTVQRFFVSTGDADSNFNDGAGGLAYSPVTDGTNGTPLTRKITHGPALSGIAYMWCGGE